MIDEMREREFQGPYSLISYGRILVSILCIMRVCVFSQSNSM